MQTEKVEPLLAGGSVDSKDESKWQTTLEGGLKFCMSESVVVDGDKTLATERYNVKKEEKRLTRQIDHLHDREMKLCEQIKGRANSKAVEVYEKLLFKVRWADPEVSLAQQALITDYVQHLLGPDPKRIFPGREYEHVRQKHRTEGREGTQRASTYQQDKIDHSVQRWQSGGHQVGSEGARERAVEEEGGTVVADGVQRRKKGLLLDHLVLRLWNGKAVAEAPESTQEAQR